MMNYYTFQFEKAYQGYWNIPTLGEKIPGVLHIEKYMVRLDLFWNETPRTSKMKIESATGYAYAQNKDKKECYYFTLFDLNITYASFFGDKQSQFSFDIADFIISDVSNNDYKKIKSICITSELLDRWVIDYTRNCFEYEYPSERVKSYTITYTPRELLTLYESERIHAYIYFGFREAWATHSGCNMSTRSFLNIEFKTKKEAVPFEDASNMSEYFIWLLSLLWNNTTSPDFVGFRTEGANFIYKQSERYSYKYTDSKSTFIRSYLSDFPPKELTSIINKWIVLINNHVNALSTFFETQYNHHITPIAAIKNYISVIDEMSKDLHIKNNGQIKRGIRTKEIDTIFEKVESGYDKIGLNKDELTILKNAIYRQSSKDLNVRFPYIFKTIENYVDIYLKSDFCDKAINTRNFITHLKGRNGDLFSKEEYWSLAVCLERIIISYLLHELGVKSDIAKKIVGEITMKE